MKLLKLISPSDEELLRSAKVASPCHESWEGMPGGEAVRSCDRCQQKVYNLSEMSAADAAKLVREAEGRLCVRFYKRADGTMLTKDCPVGATAARSKKVRTALALSGAAAAAAGFAVRSAKTSTPEPIAPVVVITPEPAPVEVKMGEMTIKEAPDPAVPHVTMGMVAPDPKPEVRMGRVARLIERK